MSRSEEFKAKRRRLGWTQTETAEALGVWPATVSTWETGRRNPPKMALKFLDSLIIKDWSPIDAPRPSTVGRALALKYFGVDMGTPEGDYSVESVVRAKKHPHGPGCADVATRCPKCTQEGVMRETLGLKPKSPPPNFLD